MLYKFKSKAAGDVIMLGPNGDQVMRLLGREPAPKGIIEVAAMAQAIAALRKAVADEEAVRGGDAGQADGGSEAEGREPSVSLHQRVWPLIEMLERSQAARADVVWGV